MQTSEGSITYLNSGDWVENLSSLEFTDGKWSVYRFSLADSVEMIMEAEVEDEMKDKQIFDNMLLEFNIMRH